MSLARCIRCGDDFSRAEGEEWKRLCFDCWLRAKKLKERDQATAQTVAKPDPLVGELREQLPGLVRLCHPDKHSNSKLANAVTQWLLSLRERLSERGTV